MNLGIDHVYHLMPSCCIGEYIIPSSSLKKIDPAAYQTSTSQRTDNSIFDVQIPPLACSLADVVFMSVIHPSEIYDAIENLGIERSNIFQRFRPPNNWFKIPFELLNESKILLKHNQGIHLYKRQGCIPVKDCIILPSMSQYSPRLSPTDIDNFTYQYYTYGLVYPFMHLQQLLYKGKVSFNGLETIRIN